ncbi:MAG: HNH endonuclease [Rhodobacteraceae bacterium]|nr:HNH endonuclease [Paracoccaceae bacterium]
MKGRALSYSAKELAWIEAHKTQLRRTAHTEFCQAFKRSDISFSNYNSLCKRKGWVTGRTGCYAPGSVPENKGKKMPFNANSARTQFKKGQLPHNTKHLGHERITKDGYVEISVAEKNPHTGYERRHVQKHRWLWEKANGPVPIGMVLKCLDGDKTNTALANWEAIPRAMLPRLNGRWSLGYDKAEANVKPVIMAAAKLEQKARELKGGS